LSVIYLAGKVKRIVCFYQEMLDKMFVYTLLGKYKTNYFPAFYYFVYIWQVFGEENRKVSFKNWQECKFLRIMEVEKTEIGGVVIIKPRLFEDARGYFFESFSQHEFDEKVRAIRFVQDNESKSGYGVVRGLHFQKPPFTQSKLVRVIEGSVLDVAVDIRKGSPSYGKYVSVELTAENHLQFFVPKGFAHGFAVLSEIAVFQYKCDEFYTPASEGALAWNDSDLAIDWRIPTDKVQLSKKDTDHSFLKDFDSPFDFYTSLY